MKAQLFRGDLHYADVTLHTAASGPVTALDTLWLRGLVGSLDGSEILEAEARAPLMEAEALGVRVAELLLAQGAERILQAVYGESGGDD